MQGLHIGTTASITPLGGNMKNLGSCLLTAALFLFGCSFSGVTLADNTGLYHGVNVWRGTVISAGRVDPTENIGTGYFIDANYSSVAFNFGVATKRFGGDEGLGTGGNVDGSPAYHERVNNVYLGVGFSRLFQMQYGYGNQKNVFRVRSDINARAIMDFLSRKQTPKERITLGDRLTFTFAIERYLEDERDIFDNATWGIGLLF